MTSLGSSGGGGGNIGGTIPTGERAGIIRAAMAAAHVPPPGTVEQWLRGMNTLIMRESGWNPNARNNWDINAKNGVPSQGLAQTIPPTFNSYVPASLRSRGILDPVANVAASIRYIVARYGNITNVQQANANMPPAGYAMGGRVEPTWFDDGGMIDPGLHLVANGTGRPEPVFTAQQWADIRGAKSGGATTLSPVIENHVYVGARELTDIVDERMVVHDDALARDMHYGRNV
ncbi:transglycosylase SLT domain-containing protein [Streptomyces sp. NPDC007929]|uniref:transglycosylase SLT domain-containing protein n=1 Tax=unclassified Streptomyces TaxID=2593676 RepID=UPI0036E0BF0F